MNRLAIALSLGLAAVLAAGCGVAPTAKAVQGRPAVRQAAELPTAKQVFDMVDLNHDGALSIEEFLKMPVPAGQTPPPPDKLEAMLRFMFQALDTDQSQTLSLEEFAKGFKPKPIGR